MVAINSIFKKNKSGHQHQTFFCGFFWMLKSVKHKFFSNFKFSKNKSHSANKIRWIFRELIFTTDFYINFCNEMKQSLHKTSTMHQKSLFSCQHTKETKFVSLKKQEGKLSKWVLERRSDFLQKISIIKKTWIHFQNNTHLKFVACSSAHRS